MVTVSIECHSIATILKPYDIKALISPDVYIEGYAVRAFCTPLILIYLRPF